MSDQRLGLPSASFMPILCKCPGAWNACKDLPEDKSEASEFGDTVHALAADEITEMSANERASFVCKSAEKIQDRLTLEIFGSYDGLQIWRETRFWAYDKTNTKRFSAKADKIVARDSVALITDIKALTGEVPDADLNFQIGALAVAFADDDETRGPVACHTIYGAIIQPLKKQAPIVVKYNIEQLVILKRQIMRAIDEALLENSPRLAGTHCRLCRARSTCPSAINLPMLWATPDLSVSTLTAEQIAELLPKLSTVDSIVEAIRKRAKELAAADQLPGYELNERRGRLEITDIKAARELIEKWVAKSDFNAHITVELGKIREKFVDAYSGKERTTKAEAGKEFLNLLEPVSQRGNPYKVLSKKTE